MRLDEHIPSSGVSVQFGSRNFEGPYGDPLDGDDLASALNAIYPGSSIAPESASQLFDKVVCQASAPGGVTYTFGGGFPDKIEFAGGSQTPVESYSCRVADYSRRQARTFGDPSFVPFIPEPTPSTGLDSIPILEDSEPSPVFIEGRQDDAVFVPFIPSPTPSGSSNLPSIPEEMDGASFVPSIPIQTPEDDQGFIPSIPVDDFAAVLPVPVQIRAYQK